MERRLSHGLSAIVNYGWSKLIEQDSWLNDSDLEPEKRISPFDHPQRIVAARNESPFLDVADMTRRARLSTSERARLADAGALQTLSGDRYRARWDSAGAEVPAPVLARAVLREKRVELLRLFRALDVNRCQQRFGRAPD